MPDLKELKKKVVESQLWRSMFRHDYLDTPRNRVLQIMANVWLHLHPPKIRRHAIKVRFTWCMGGITFLMFLVTVVTGVILMFYYRPVSEYAYADMKYLQFDVPFGMIMRNMHRWAAHGMVITVWLHMLRVFMTGSYKPPREFNWVVGGAVDDHVALELYRVPLALGPTVHLGSDGRHEHGPRHPAPGQRGPLCPGGRGHAALRR